MQSVGHGSFAPNFGGSHNDRGSLGHQLALDSLDLSPSEALRDFNGAIFLESRRAEFDFGTPAVSVFHSRGFSLLDQFNQLGFGGPVVIDQHFGWDTFYDDPLSLLANQFRVFVNQYVQQLSFRYVHTK